MGAQWIEEISGKLKSHHITQKQLASCLGMSEVYVSTIMNGHRSPKNAEQKFRSALEELLRPKSTAPK